MPLVEFTTAVNEVEFTSTDDPRITFRFTESVVVQGVEGLSEAQVGTIVSTHNSDANAHSALRSRITALEEAPGGGGGGDVASVDGRTGVVTLSDLYEVAGAAAAVAGTLATVATTGSYGDLSDRPTLGTAAAADTTAFATSAQGTLAGTAVQPAAMTAYAEPIGAAAAVAATLSAVATSGAYGDLSGRPTLATVATSGSYTDLSNKPTVAPFTVIPDSRHIISTFGTPAWAWENTAPVTNVALALTPSGGNVAFGNRRSRTDLRRILFNVAATNLTSGNIIEIVCYGLDVDGLPGVLQWMVPITLGATTGDVNHDLGADSGIRLPDGGYWIGILNRSSNAGTVTFKNFTPANRSFSNAADSGGTGRWAAVLIPAGTTAASDLSEGEVNSAANSGTRIGYQSSAPGIWLR
jgi:hypothetical protein